MYKIAPASRPDGPVIDTCGPWLKNDTGWPAVWWNLNVQLTYWICYTSNQQRTERKYLCAAMREMAGGGFGFKAGCNQYPGGHK